jgi:hypothetical protein
MNEGNTKRTQIPVSVNPVVPQAAEHVNNPNSSLRDRLVLAALNTLTDGDPLLLIGIGHNEVRLGWADE